VLESTNRSGLGFGFGFGRAPRGGGGCPGLEALSVTRRTAGWTPSVFERAVNVTAKLRPAVLAGGFQCTLADAGFPGTGLNDAPAGRPAASIVTVAREPPGAVAATLKFSCVPTTAFRRAPSAGVGAVHVTDGTALGRADTAAGTARHSSAAPARIRPCRPPIRRG
jgi:hypothetical protein